MRNKLLAAGMAAVLATTWLPAPAAAAEKGCKYPRVCFYLKASDWAKRKPTAAYQIKTQDFQMLGKKARHARAVYNSRRDDAVLLLLPGRAPGGGDRTVCVGPRKSKVFAAGQSRIIGVLIADEARCDRLD